MPEQPKHDEKKEIVEPSTAAYVQLDDISCSLADIVRLLTKNQESLNILTKEVLDDRDEGEYLRREDTATTTYTIYDLLSIIEHPVKGYEIKNDGTNPIRVGHNITPGSIDPSIQPADARFNTIFQNEDIKFTYNRRKINNVYVRTTTGTSDFRIKFIW